MELDFSQKAMELSRQMEDRGLTGRENYKDEVCIDGMEYLARHFYLPVIYSTGRKVDYLRHIIEAGSEVEFLEDFKKFVSKPGNPLSQLKWWMFSKLDPYLDIAVCIPYYDPKQNKVRSFVPDFIFWGFDGEHYRIVFVDPKGIVHDEWRNKVAGYKQLFEEQGQPKTFIHGDATVSVHLCLYHRRRDHGAIDDECRYWFDDPQTLFESVFG